MGYFYHLLRMSIATDTMLSRNPSLKPLLHTVRKPGSMIMPVGLFEPGLIAYLILDIVSLPELRVLTVL